MAKKAGVLQPTLNSYDVLPTVQGNKLGPYTIVQGTNNRRTVLLTTKQAKYWLDQGAIRASQN